MDHCPDDDRPTCGFVQGEVLVEGDDVVQWCLSEERNEIAADREEDEDDVDMKQERCSTGDGLTTGK